MANFNGSNRDIWLDGLVHELIHELNIARLINLADRALLEGGLATASDVFNQDHLFGRKRVRREKKKLISGRKTLRLSAAAAPKGPPR